ncbi:GTP pyrophosphokinase family protein [uncultured Serinicoccus sp.]|uniref:GTP pyrophosphokinase n=1 Tax=uncultured Serinicoccus sp. TaxID=735514 RepID=UPI00262372ED|nr:GTP pyrophosphokinase family protein [uncultured Serinicoccus sp.]
MSTAAAAEPPSLALATEGGITPAQLREVGSQLQRFLLEYEFGLREVETKIEILRDEFAHMHDYNPIEHVSSRVKSPDSLREKVLRRGLSLDLETIRREITDIAGIRVSCSFVTDAYRIFDLLTQQDDLTIRRVSDYIAEPKENGYASLHAIVEIPVFLSTGRVDVPVEVQLRTIAMDFWASTEHKIHYKYDGNVPEGLLTELKDAATSAAELDARMQRLHRELHGTGPDAQA